MVNLSDAQLQRWKEIFAKDGIFYDTDEDYREAVKNLVGYFEILIEMDKAQKLKATLKPEHKLPHHPSSSTI